MSIFPQTRPFLRTLLPTVILGASLGLGLAGCAADPKEEAYRERPVEELYNEAMDFLNQEEYQAAAKSFDEVERQHPYSVWATKAELMGAFAQYQRNKFDDAIVSLDRFIQLHPSHRDVAYAYYLKALCYYEQIADVARDQKMTEHALKSMQEVVDRFPNSRYARDAKMKVDLARDHMAGKEMNIGRYYQQRRQYLAAINRYRLVIDNFQTTTDVPEALHRLIECYEALGLAGEAKKAAAVLGYNYPGSDWYSDSFELVTGDKAFPTGAKAAPPKDGDDAPIQPKEALAQPKKDPGWFSWLW